MSLPTTAYVRFDSGVEEIQPNEQQLIDETVESMARVNRFMFEKHRHAIRDAHAKSHGILRGELHVYPNLPAHLAQGMFRQPRVYPVIIRLSSAPGSIDSDTQSAVKGMAVKIIGVEGRKFLPDQTDEVTQDFLLVNDTIIPTGDIKSYHDMQLRQEKVFIHAPEVVTTLLTEAGTLVNQALDAVGIKKEIPLVVPPHPHNHILGETFTTLGAIRFGDYVSKISVAPLSANVQALAGEQVKITDQAGWRDLVVDFFRAQGAEYELRAQLCTDLQAMPVEDAAVDWPQDQSPYQPLGKIVIPAQEAFSPARRAFADDVLSFNPFHCLPEHLPLGSINRARIQAYETSTAYRHRMNAQPRLEPRDINELPD
ncbi:catalase family protein [Hymenobacter monticola]|uniref:Catalase family protein n=2 Tax=Hymenobacter TaxID=89966 RepID=A0ABY4BF04_9BACT|nr:MULTISPECIES: catalase family protein [Hymenobacter]MDU0372302.1 catalase family protein [Hymenobacter endophyticus]UOE36581.1 catalase family protein [Hymenobacter monticola]